jgi:hypothetical protein
MAQARPVAPSPSVPRVHVIAPARLGATAIAALRARGLDARTVQAAADVSDGDVLAWALDAPPSPATAVELAAVCTRAAASGRPVSLLAPAPIGAGRPAIERAAALAYLRSHGAALAHDVDAWLEAIVALVRFGMPRGPRAAVIAPPGSWLEAQALAIALEAEQLGVRPPLVGAAAERAGGDEPTDVVLYDSGLGAPPGELPGLGAPPGELPGLAIPVAARAELALADGPALFGARAALAAIDVLGRAAERIAVGLGPAPRAASAELAINQERLARQLDRFARTMRVGDHETKVLLSSYGVPITRQAVATTPSAAVKAARRAGYPVELKPWGDDLPTEPAGCPIERGIASDALVRRAFAAVLAAAGKPAEGGAVIVREPPPSGRELSVAFVRLPALGWTVVVDAPGAPGIIAAPAPLRLIDATALATSVVASRAGDPEPDRIGLANLLRRASHLVCDLGDRLAHLELPRVVVGGRGALAVVADAWCELG